MKTTKVVSHGKCRWSEGYTLELEVLSVGDTFRGQVELVEQCQSDQDFDLITVYRGWDECLVRYLVPTGSELVQHGGSPTSCGTCTVAL